MKPRRSNETSTRLSLEISQALVGVMSRPRFGIHSIRKIETNVWREIHEMECDGYQYQLRVVHSRNICSIAVIALNEWDRENIFYSKTVNLWSLPNIRKIGTTISNKIKLRAVYQVMQ